jgi:dienelactone hydrolase
MTRVVLDAAGARLAADVVVPAGATGVVVCVHDCCPDCGVVVEALHRRGLATVLLDLLTPEESHLGYDIGLLADRLVATVDHAAATVGLAVGVFGASTGGTAALTSAAARPGTVRAVVSRSGRPDLAGAALAGVSAPTLLIVGADDAMVADLNERALTVLAAPAELRVVPATGERDGLAEVAVHAGDWFAGALR